MPPGTPLPGVFSVTQPSSVVRGALRRSLTHLRAQQGLFIEARFLLGKGQTQLRGVHAAELGKLLRRRALVELLAGVGEAASGPLNEAVEIADALDLNDDAMLRQMISQVQSAAAD